MCNACGNVCCGSDEFGGCGCDGCDEPDCWTPDDNDFDFPRCCPRSARAPIRCEELPSP